jgi:transcriptional regulator with XRE-family HTH domain
LADKIFVSRSAIAKWENGFGMASLESIEILCEFLNVTKEYLLKEDEPLQIIENVQKRSRKKLIFVSAFLVPLVLYFVVSIIFSHMIKLMIDILGNLILFIKLDIYVNLI